MKKNVGKTDQIVRVVIAAILVLAGFMYLSGILQILSFLVAIVLLLTAAFKTCCLYSLLGINTCKMDK